MRRLTRWATALVVLVSVGGVVGIAVLRPWPFGRPPQPEPRESPPDTVAEPERETWKQAARRLEEHRGKPVGRAATVSVPAQLRHYADRRRFLAVQVAETRVQDLDLPYDWAELAYMVRDDELVAIPALGDDYLLYGVGGSVNDEPLTHHDRATGSRIALYSSWDAFKEADAAVARQLEELRVRAAERRSRLGKTARRYRTRRNALLREARSLEKEAAAIKRRRQRTAYFYDDEARRQSLIAEYHLLQNLGQTFGDGPYALEDPDKRRMLKGRLLGHLRPPARDVLLDVAADYRTSFGRHLPISSLVRPLDYQALISKTNPNATRIEEPPHATGLAFDVYYGHMDSEEQEHVMRRLARLEQEGRLEALRENLNHFHVFVFADGQPPPSRLVSLALDEVGPAPRVTTRRP